MKKTLSVLFALLISCITASAQIQNGYVRSQGTSYNRTGSPLKGARECLSKDLTDQKLLHPTALLILILVGARRSLALAVLH